MKEIVNIKVILNLTKEQDKESIFTKMEMYTWEIGWKIFSMEMVTTFSSVENPTKVNFTEELSKVKEYILI